MTASWQEELIAATHQLADKFTNYAAQTRGLSTNDVLSAGMVQINDDGYASVHTTVPAAGITVWNNTSSHVLVTNQPPGQPGRVAPGQAELGAGAWACYPFIGNVFTIYGRPGTRLSVAVMSRVVDPSGGTLGDAPWHAVKAGPAGVAASGIVYTHPWAASGLMPVYGGFSLIETAGTITEFRVWDFVPSAANPTPTFANANYLGGLIVGASSSVDFELSGGLRANSGSIYLEVIGGGGTLAGTLRVR